MEQKKHNIILVAWAAFVLLLVPSIVALSDKDSTVAENFRSASTLSHFVGVLFLLCASAYAYLYATDKVTVTGSWKFDFYLAIFVILTGLVGFMGFFWGYF